MIKYECQTTSERNELINMKSCNLLDSPAASTRSHSLQLTLSALLFFTVRTRQVLVAIDHKDLVSSPGMVEALLPVFLKKISKIYLHIQEYHRLNHSECPIVHKNKLCAFDVIHKELHFVETIPVKLQMHN